MSPPVSQPHEGLNAAVAAELRAELGRRRFSVAALAERSEIPYGSLRRYLGEERHIDVEVLDRLARALDVSAAELVNRAVANQVSEPAPSLALVADEGDVEPGDLE